MRDQPTRGVVSPLIPRNSRVSLCLDAEVLEWFRSQVREHGGGHDHTRINAALPPHIVAPGKTLEDHTRRMVREEWGAHERPHRRTVPMRIDLRTLQPNLHRDLTIDPMDPDLLAPLKESIQEDGFGGGMACRRVKGPLQIAAGHHRVQAALAAGITPRPTSSSARTWTPPPWGASTPASMPRRAATAASSKRGPSLPPSACEGAS
jgi:hypothetical protein